MSENPLKRNNPKKLISSFQEVELEVAVMRRTVGAAVKGCEGVGKKLGTREGIAEVGRSEGERLGGTETETGTGAAVLGRGEGEGEGRLEGL